MSRVLVFGQHGQVASALREHFPDARFVASSEFNFRRPDKLHDFLTHARPSLIINPAAFTRVDDAERALEEARLINAAAPAAIAEWCAENRASFVHYSTDYVYPGSGSREWTEKDFVGPVNAYGRTKLQGEDAIRRSGCHHYILRTSWVFGGSGTNFVRKMIELGRTREHLSVIDDQIGSPTYAADLARTTRDICEHARFRAKGGTFNVTNSGFISWYGFASEIFSRLRTWGLPLKVLEVRPVGSDEFITPARRPLNSRMSKARLESELGLVLRPWEEALEEYLRYLVKTDSAKLERSF